jgi:intron-binding protein aquarius
MEEFKKMSKVAKKGKRKFAPKGTWHSHEFGTDSAHRSSAWSNERYVRECVEKWSSPRFSDPKSYDPQMTIPSKLYREELLPSKFSPFKIKFLEFSQYLENYLWPTFDPDQSSLSHVISIAVMVNEKFRERVSAWEPFTASPEKFPSLFTRVSHAVLDKEISIKEKTVLLIFLIHSFNSLEEDLIRTQVQKMVSLSSWTCLLPERRDEEFKRHTRLKKYWNHINKKDAKLDSETRERVQWERSFLSKLIKNFYTVLYSIDAEAPVEPDVVNYCERFLEFVIDLEAQLPTRRFINTLLDDHMFVVKCSLSSLVRRDPEGHLFHQLLDRVKFYAGFEINDQTGAALTDHEMVDLHYDKIISLQRTCFKLYPELRSFALSNVASIDQRKSLLRHFSPLSHETLHQIAASLHLVEAGEEIPPKVLIELLSYKHERRQSQIQKLNNMPVYPTEEILWDENIVPNDYYYGDGCLALPKLNLQFLTLHDYLLRNFILFRLESTYEIRQDIEDAVSRLKPWVTPQGTTEFSGWAKMANAISDFSIVEVVKPNVGERKPARVRADVTLQLSVHQSVKEEWEALRKHDVCFLITCRPSTSRDTTLDLKSQFIPQVGLMSVRGCEVEGMLDENGKVIEEGPEPKPKLSGDSRTWRVLLDTNQYQMDMERTMKGAEDVYNTFNVFMRRRPKENNFKAVLETIRFLMNTECVVPEWMHDVLLGYGDPAAANYKSFDNRLTSLDWNDTFLDLNHLRSCFPDHTIECSGNVEPRPPYRLSFPVARGNKRPPPADNADEDQHAMEKLLMVEPYSTPNRGPYPYNQPKRNSVRFTSTQVEAIHSGMQSGLTLIVGPPGTGKTDVAVQIISNLYHNFPDQRILLVTHSNQALNQLFEKIMALDIDERHLLRLGHGEEELATDKDFSRYGRVNFILSLRLRLLKEVERLQHSLGVAGDVAYTCETAGHFFLYQIVSRWEEFISKVKPLVGKAEGVATISAHFPFHEFFSNAPQPVFKGETFAQDMDIAEGCYRHISRIFKQLEEFRAFELLRSSYDRTNYLLIKEAKIIAMTCTHAALKRKDLVDLAFNYDSVIMEESAQILEVETFIPMMLQKPQDGHCRLKRVIMIGDHHQLPPVIQNMAFQKYSNMEQSMFTRFVRLGVPTIQLDAQGRARPSLCELYQWRYQNLGNLPHVVQEREFQLANPGFFYDYQLVNVEDFNGVGETEPNPHFYQNLGEAEFVVALYMYMRLQGYPPEKITILTTYNGQKHLIRDVLNKRCARNPVFGLPSMVTTVDRFQGQQNDYILLSLVRTKLVGHLRDVRRLVVAMSRARLGLYIFGRVSLFKRCHELQPAFNILMRRPLFLHLAPFETFPSSRHVDTPTGGPPLVIESMTHLAKLTYEEYNIRVAALHQVKRLVAPPVQYTRKQTEQETRDEGSGQEEKASEDDKEKVSEDDKEKANEDDKETPMESEPGEFDNLLGDQDGGDSKRKHDPTIPAEIMEEIEEGKTEENPEFDDNNEGGVASSDEEVVS